MALCTYNMLSFLSPLTLWALKLISYFSFWPNCLWASPWTQIPLKRNKMNMCTKLLYLHKMIFCQYTSHSMICIGIICFFWYEYGTEIAVFVKKSFHKLNSGAGHWPGVLRQHFETRILGGGEMHVLASSLGSVSSSQASSVSQSRSFATLTGAPTHPPDSKPPPSSAATFYPGLPLHLVEIK